MYIVSGRLTVNDGERGTLLLPVYRRMRIRYLVTQHGYPFLIHAIKFDGTLIQVVDLRICNRNDFSSLLEYPLPANLFKMPDYDNFPFNPSHASCQKTVEIEVVNTMDTQNYFSCSFLGDD